MKPANLFFCFLMVAPSVYAQYPQQQNQGSNQPQQGPSIGERCRQTLDIQKGIRATQPQLPLTNRCEYYSIVASMAGQGIDAPREMRMTADGKIPCQREAGFTVDFDACKKVAQAYDAVIIAEKAMITAQTVLINESNIKATKEVTARTAQGDGHNAAIDATIKRNKMNAQLYKTQAMAYGAAVATLSSYYASWPGKKYLSKKCAESANSIAGAAKDEFGYEGFSATECLDAVSKVERDSMVFQNNNAKALFFTAIGQFAIKAKQAYDMARQSEFVGEKLKKVVGPGDEEGTYLEKCFITPEAPGCKGAGGKSKVSSGDFKGNSVSFGAGSSGQSFDFTDGESGGSGDGLNGAVDGSESIADVASPFEKEAKEASGILNPAGAATVTPGSQPSAPGGGGAGGGGGGGGSASLGDDLAGAAPEETKEPEINSKKVTGRYKSGGKTQAFQPVGKRGEKDANPFASMFDNNKASEGGIEEDRSIASNVTGEASELFQRISKKYGVVQQEKRLEAGNLE